MPPDTESDPAIITDNEAWKRHPGPILLLAGPGTGKTHQLALRIKDLVENKNVSPHSITVITFTREAAANMRNRIADEGIPEVYIPSSKRPARITTMHSLGLDIVRSHAKVLGLPEDFEVLTDTGLRSILFHDAALFLRHSEADGEAADTFRQCHFREQAPTPLDQIIAQYEKLLRANKAIDYDDQIMLALTILSMDNEVYTRYSQAAIHLLVDEYQDINPAQKALIQLLSRDHKDGLFVAGDDDQSIYSFRGGTPTYIRQFRQEYAPQGQVISLTESRRCPLPILNSALRLVQSFDPTRLAKPTPTFKQDKEQSGRVTIHDVATDRQEAEIIAQVAHDELPSKSMLVLIPARQYAEPIKQSLRRRRIAYHHPLFVDDSGLLVLQTLYRWTRQPGDNLLLRSCIDTLCESGALGIPTSRHRKQEAKEKRHNALCEITALWKYVLDDQMTLWNAVERKKTEGHPLFTLLYEQLKELKDIDAANVHEFLTKATHSAQPWRDLDDLMKEVGVWAEELRAHRFGYGPVVKIMTLQAAKGLEGDVVCVVGFNDGIIPRPGSPLDLPESARLAYVSMTRAKEELHLFHARKREASTTYLAQSFQLKPSRFLGVFAKHDRVVKRYHQAPSKKTRNRLDS